MWLTKKILQFEKLTTYSFRQSKDGRLCFKFHFNSRIIFKGVSMNNQYMQFKNDIWNIVVMIFCCNNFVV